LDEPIESCDALIIGAGLAGLYMLHRLRNAGLRVQVVEAGTDVGGTWYWNRYPGARCDVESMEYSYQFSPELQQQWNWSERYAGQAEILDYARHVANRFELRDNITFNTRITSVWFEESSSSWLLRSDTGKRWRSRFCIAATGCLSIPNTPEIPGREHFKGNVYHTGAWPHSPVDFSGKRVAVIGTGSSAIQAIPVIAEQCAQLTVFQRTPHYSVPARNQALDPALSDHIKDNYADFRASNQAQSGGFGARYPHDDDNAVDASPAERQRRFEAYYQTGGLLFLRAFGDTMRDPRANLMAQNFTRQKIRERVTDPTVAELLSPETTIGCKRLCADSGYYEAFNRENVNLVDLPGEAIECFTDSGLRTVKTDYSFDEIILATGFDAMTGALMRMDIRGRKGCTLTESWRNGPNTLLGLQAAGFPNLFMITGPGSPSVLSNMLQSIEQHVEYIARLIDHMRSESHTVVEAQPDAADNWMSYVASQASETVFHSCNSWYLGANIPGKPRVFMPCIDYPKYVAQCEDIASDGYRGFSFS
jgi:cation diffusion facilitator CzcD-associated flavoprotein CzcO